MKKLLIISTAAIAALSMTGCNPGSGSTSGTETRQMLISREETTNGVETFTEYEYDEKTLAQTGETREIDSRPYYEISDYETNIEEVGNQQVQIVTTSRREQFTGDDEYVAGIYRQVETVSGNNTGDIYSQIIKEVFEEFLIVGEGASETVPWKKTETEIDYYYDSTVSYVEYEKGVEVLRRSDFKYADINSGGLGYFSYKEKRGADATPVDMYYKVTARKLFNSGPVTGYRLYEGTDDTGTMVEEMSDYEAEDETETTYTIWRFPVAGGPPVVTRVEERYKEMTIELY